MDAATLAREKQISLTTFKRDGTPVSTPVWTVSDDGRRLLVWSAADTWKVKRIRRDPHVRVAGCDFHGTIHTDVREISRERRNGYAWYSEIPRRVLEEYEKWSAEISRKIP